MGKFKNDVTGVGGRGYPKLVTKSDIGGGGHKNIEITPPPPPSQKKKKIMFKFLFFACFWSARQQLSFG